MACPGRVATGAAANQGASERARCRLARQPVRLERVDDVEGRPANRETGSPRCWMRRASRLPRNRPASAR